MDLLLMPYRLGHLLLMPYWEGSLLLLSCREGGMRILPGLHVHVGPISISGELARLSLGGDHTILLPGLRLGVGRMRFPGLRVLILLPGLGGWVI